MFDGFGIVSCVLILRIMRISCCSSKKLSNSCLSWSSVVGLGVSSRESDSVERSGV